MQLKNLQGLVGKTIKEINDRAVNCVEITFTDDIKVILEAENILPSLGLIGIVGYSDNLKIQSVKPTSERSEL